MQRRQVLMMLGFGAAAVGAVGLTMSPAQAATALSQGRVPAGGAVSTDAFLKDLAATSESSGAFAQYRRRRRRARVCRMVRTSRGWRRVCRWGW